MKTVERLFDGPLDVVGDVHGQYDALQDLLGKLNYGLDGSHPDGRRLVFVGDLIDRGPDSPAVAEQVLNMVHAGNAQCVLGNHELNIVRNAKKLDNGWFFGHETSNGQAEATEEQKIRIRKFFKNLPLALERPDLRIVHACWSKSAIDSLPRWLKFARHARCEYQRFRRKTNKALAKSGFAELYEKEKLEFDDLVRFDDKNPDSHWPDARLLEGYAAVNEARQMGNPIAVLTSGEERAAKQTYPAGGKFRFVDRVAWWKTYNDDQAVIIGHYWRLYDFGIVERPKSAGIDVFKDTGPDQWLGAKNKVYCVDFSVGGRGRKHSSDVCRLAAVRWPEATVMFDDGEEMATNYQ
jgi:hypothetical protein